MKNIIITILIVLTIGLGGFILYDKLTTKENVSNEIDNSNKTNNMEEKASKEVDSKTDLLKYYEGLANNRKTISMSKDNFTVVLSNEGDIYYALNLDDQGNSSKIGNQDISTYNINGFVKGITNYNPGVFKGYKLSTSNVVLMYASEGYSADPLFIFIKSDGKLATLNYKNGKVDFNDNISGYENIVAIGQSDQNDNVSFVIIKSTGEIINGSSIIK